MKAASAGLINLLNSNQEFIMADLYTITLIGGTVLQYTNVEGGVYFPQNLLKYSEDFTNSAWIKTNCSAANSSLSPDGSRPASLITATAAANTFTNQLYTCTPQNQIYNYSIWVKGGTGSTAPGQTFGLYINDGSGAVQASQSFTFSAGWTRVSLSAQFSAGSANNVNVFVDPTNTAAIGDTFSLFGGQLQQPFNGIALNSYVPTGASNFTSSRYFDGSSILIDRGTLRSVIGTQVDTLDVTVTASPTHMIGTTPWLQAAKIGLLDGASLKLERCFMPTFGDTSLGTVILFSGAVAEVDAGRNQAVLRINSDLHMLNRQMPRNLYQPACLNSLFDTQCGLTKATYGFPGTVTTVNTNLNLTTNIVTAAGYHNQGTITFTGGANSGISRTIKSNDGLGGIVLINPLPSIPQIGDTFTAYAGCDKQFSTCSSGKFNNVIKFHGFPFVPAPESVY